MAVLKNSFLTAILAAAVQANHRNSGMPGRTQSAQTLPYPMPPAKVPGPNSPNPFFPDPSKWPTPPSWPSQYSMHIHIHLEGIINGPQLQEDVFASYDEDNNLATIQYDDSQSFDVVNSNGQGLRLAYGNAQAVCLEEKHAGAEIVSLIPDLTEGFAFVGYQTIAELDKERKDVADLLRKEDNPKSRALVWQRTNSHGASMDGHWTFYTSDVTGKPLLWHMHSRQANWDGHTDEYFLLYNDFQAGTTNSMMSVTAGNIPSEFQDACNSSNLVPLSAMRTGADMVTQRLRRLSVPFVTEMTTSSMYSPLPRAALDLHTEEIKEALKATASNSAAYLHSAHNTLNDAFMAFKLHYNKNYSTAKEERMAAENFTKNLAMIHELNESGHARFEPNAYLDQDAEKRLSASKGRRNITPLSQKNYTAQANAADLPSVYDWRVVKDGKALTSPQDQAICGSCWAFGLVQSIEAMHFLANENVTGYVKVPEQLVMDCTWDIERLKKGVELSNMACNGGESDEGSRQLINRYDGKMPSTEDYSPYLGVDAKCKDMTNMPASVQVLGYNNIPQHDDNAVMNALVMHGPLAIAINVVMEMIWYSSGVVQSDSCKQNSMDDLDHEVTLLGYGELDASQSSSTTLQQRGSMSNMIQYWSIKNQWSVYWGNDGYFYIERGARDCGVATDAGYPTMQKLTSKTQLGNVGAVRNSAMNMFV